MEGGEPRANGSSDGRTNNEGPRVAVIIPAYNEEGRVREVVRAVQSARRPTEILVVSDGSKDRTVEVASGIVGVRVVDLKENVGKGGAMAAGVAATGAEIVAFVDADLGGLTGRHIDAIIDPVYYGLCEMAVGVFRGGKAWSDAAQRISPALSGQRAMKRSLFLAVPDVGNIRMGIEIALNQAAKRRRARVKRVVLRGVSNTHKEQKLGFVKGLAARTKMYKEITEAMVRTRRPKRARRRRRGF